MNKILIIEDDKILLEMYKDKFVNDGFAVETALDGKEGIEKMRSFLPNVVILDLIMPKVSGFEVLKMVKQDKVLSTIPLIVLTNIYTDAEDMVKNWGVDYYLLKSDYTPETIVEKVKNILQLNAQKNPSQ